MKKIILLSALTLIFGCGSTPQTVKVPEVEVPAATQEQSFKDVKLGNWQYTVPSDFEKRTSNDIVLYRSPDGTLLISGIESQFAGSLDDLTTEKVGIVTGDDLHMTVLGNKNVEVDGTPATLVAAKNDVEFVAMLMMVENNQSCIILCGGHLNSMKASLKTCGNVLDSVKHNKD